MYLAQEAKRIMAEAVKAAEKRPRKNTEVGLS